MITYQLNIGSYNFTGTGGHSIIKVALQGALGYTECDFFDKQW